MSGCEHGFIVSDIQGDHRFLCRMCNTRFLRYPQNETWQEELDKELGWDILQEALKKFQPGFINRINKPEFVHAKGVYVGQVTYKFLEDNK